MKHIRTRIIRNSSRIRIGKHTVRYEIKAESDSKDAISVALLDTNKAEFSDLTPVLPLFGMGSVRQSFSHWQFAIELLCRGHILLYQGRKMACISAHAK